MRRLASTLVAAIALVIGTGTGIAASDKCELDPGAGQIVCRVAGGEVDPVPPGDPAERKGKRYVHTTTDPVIGDCHYWSDVPGGLDSWDASNDPAIIAITTTLPECPTIPATDPVTRAWEIFRSWDLDGPSLTITPPFNGFTGTRTDLAAPPPDVIVHDEILPDGRALRVRARVAILDVDWGDGVTSSHPPDDATGYPDGDVAHVYTVKTCSADYRTSHPSGRLCHPSLDRYTIVAVNGWVGEYQVGGAWIILGRLDRSASIDYDVDEVRGVTASRPSSVTP